MRTQLTIKLILGLAAGLMVASLNNASATIVSTRQAAMISSAYVSPWPSTNTDTTSSGGDFLGKAAYALAAYYLHSNLTQADNFINNCNLEPGCGVPDNDQFKNITGEFAFPLLIRIGMGNNINGNRMTNSMGANPYTNLLDMIWSAIDSRSETNLASAGSNKVWGVIGSENHNSVWNSTFFLGAQLLNTASSPIYGPGNLRHKLTDDGTILQHYTAWLAYWENYFLQRAREGIDMEVSSPTYEKYSLAGFYNIADFGGAGADNAECNTQATNFLTLYWADAANEFCVGSTIRGGGGTRMYQDNHLTTGTAVAIRYWYYMYDWHDTGPTSTDHPEILTAAMSPYVIPDIVNAIATNVGAKAPYEYARHALGAGIDDTHNDDDYYKLTIPGEVRKDTSWTPEFVVGTMTYDSTKTYADDGGENRFCSIQFSNGVNDRLIVQGIGTGKTDTADQLGVTGACWTQSLVASLGKDAKNNAGMHIFVANTLFGHLKTNGNWLLTYAGNGYAGIRVATGGYSWVTTNSDGTTCTDGEFLKLGDKWSPLVIQCAQASNYANTFGTFTTACVGTYFNYNTTSNSMTYTNLMGERFIVWRDSDTLPVVGSAALLQDAGNAYYGPYLNGTYGSNTMTISYSGFTDQVLDFTIP